jgi:hypothetical protein
LVIGWRENVYAQSKAHVHLTMKRKVAIKGQGKEWIDRGSMSANQRNK